MKTNQARWAIFISGLGSNAAELIDARAENQIELIVSSRATAPGLARCRRAGIDTLILSSPIQWPALLEELFLRRITHIFLAGFMRIVPADFLNQWTGVIVNVHPSLLPEYPGIGSIECAVTDKKPLGVTTHFVTALVDSGEHILQAQVLPLVEQNQKSLAELEFLTHLVEHRLVKRTMEAIG